MSRLWICVGALWGALGIAIGAFGAHWLQSAVKEWVTDPEQQARQLEIWETGVRYQMYQALALMVVGVLASGRASTWHHAAGGSMLFGSLIFSGCLYLLVLTGVRALGAVVPIGGLLMIVGWVLLAVSVLLE